MIGERVRMEREFEDLALPEVPQFEIPWGLRTVGGCTDDQLAKSFNIPLSRPKSKLARRNRPWLQALDSAFAGDSGAGFIKTIKDVAAQTKLDPACLAINVLAEKEERAIWLGTTPVASYTVGLDDWHNRRGAVRAAVSAAASIKDSIIRCTREPSCPIVGPGRCCGADGFVHFVNEPTDKHPNGRDTGPVWQFTDGPNALLAVASYLAWLRTRLGDEVRGFGSQGALQQYAAVRAAYNVGYRRGRGIAKGSEALPRTGRIGVQRNRLTTIRSVQAIHLANKFFGGAHPCP
jgi:hypothetical protein